nr:hypothetical protein [Tanacetum cinerariifolium]
MTIDKSWTSISNRNSGEFLRGLHVFLEHCKTLLDPIFEEIACPCDLCGNSQTGSINTLWTHISENGFDSTYTIWDKHGELLPPPPPPPQPPSPEYDNMAAFLDEIIRPDNESTQTTGPQPTQTTDNESTQTTGPQPTQTTGPQPTQTMGPHIDNEFEALFSRATDKLYPGCTWMTDKLYPGCTWMTSLDFLAKMSHAKVLDPRNIRLRLAADGFNLFGNLSRTYSMWPVILTTYNTPPWICMKETSFMVMMLIPGPKSPAKDIDVFLQPLIREL